LDLMVHLHKLRLKCTGTIRENRVTEKNIISKKSSRGSYVVKHNKNIGMNYICSGKKRGKRQRSSPRKTNDERKARAAGREEKAEQLGTRFDRGTVHKKLFIFIVTRLFVIFP